MLNKGFSTEDLLSAASGGNSTHLYTDSGDYKIHKFTADGTFTVNIPTILFDILVIAGGGSGATCSSIGNPGLITESGGDGDGCGGTAGTDGNGGDDAANCNQGAGGGGGFYTNGQDDSSYGAGFGYAFLNGGSGGADQSGGA